MGDTDQARGLMRSAIAQAGERAPPALLNNLGLLELNEGNFGAALDLFRQAMQSLQSEIAAGGNLSVGSGGSEAEETILMNIQRSQESIVHNT